MSDFRGDAELIAGEFEALWTSETRPEIRGFLDRAAPAQQELLAQLLVRIDVVKRTGLGEPIQLLDDYGALTPNLQPFLIALGQEIAGQRIKGNRSSTVAETAAQVSAEFQQTERHQPQQDSASKHIGAYKLITPLGKGGMGEVWMAEQEKPIRRNVALKLIKAGGRSKEILARFELERQSLALMDHPNIARILDAGTTSDGQPFFAMELVRGRPITDHCTEYKLSIDDRIRLFADVCSGVQHAHQKGIIHRDLKPSNILVGMVEGKPVPKIIDFGLAKALQSANRLTDQTLYTGIGQILGTLRYMSPEQAALNPYDIDTRTDIYSLGIVLYELLTGVTPLDEDSLRDHAVLNVLEQIRNREPVKPSSRLSQSGAKGASITDERRTDMSSLNRVLVGDLDWIVMKALEKDRERRYESASVFALDLMRFLHNEPVLARPPSIRYRVHKFVGKNRMFVAGSATLLAALLLGTIGTSIGLVRARQAEALAELRLAESVQAQTLEAEQRQLAEQRREIADQATLAANAAKELAELRQSQTARGVEILAGIFDDLDIGAIREGNDPLEQVLANRLVSSSQLLEEQTVGAPLEVAELQTKLSMALMSLGFPDPAVDLLQKVLAAETQLHGEDSDAALATMINLATAHESAGNPELASPLIEQSLEGNRRKHGPEHPDTLTCLSRFANLLMQLGEFDKATPLLEETLALQESAPAIEPMEKMITMTLLGQAHSIAGELDKAVPLFEKALSAVRALYGDGHQTTLSAMHNLAAAYLEQNEFRKATDLFEQTLELSKTNLGESHPDTIATRQSLAMAFQRQGRIAEAVKLFEISIAQQTEKLGIDHPETLINRNNLAIAYSDAGQLGQALPLAKETLRLTEQKFGPSHPDTLGCMNTLASLLLDNEQPQEAMAIRVRLIEGMKAVYGERHPLTLRAVSNLSVIHGKLGEYQEAIKILQETLRIREEVLGNGNPDTVRNRAALGVNYGYLGEFELAISMLEVAMQQMKEVLGDDHPETLAISGNLATMYSSAKKPEKAIPMLEQTIALQKSALGPEHPEVLARTSDLVSAYADLQLWDKAQPLAEENLAVTRTSMGETHTATLDAITVYADVLQSTGEVERAIELLEGVVSQQRKGTADHPDLIDSLAALATAVDKAGDDVRANNLLEEAANALLRRKFAQRTAPDIMQRLTSAYERMELWDKSEQWHRSYADALRRAGDGSRLRLIVELERLGATLLQQEKWSDAQIALGEAIDYQKEVNAEDAMMYMLQGSYGASLLGQKKYNEAEKQLLASFSAMKAAQAAANDNSAETLRAAARTTLDRLIQLYEALEKPAEVQKWRLEREQW